MKTIAVIYFNLITVLGFTQASQFDFPDTLWTYGQSLDSNYGFTKENPIKVGGGILPKHIYRYLNSIVDSSDTKISYKRIGSCCQKSLNRQKPLTVFSLTYGNYKNREIYFDNYEWDYPKLPVGIEWRETRTGYFGEYKNDTIFEGFGIYFMQDGGYYKGQFINGIMEGHGIMYYPDQEKYTGQFHEGKYHGQGTLEYPDGGKYVGDWENGNRNGHCKIFYPLNSKIKYIEGFYIDDNPEGEFIIFNSDGTKDTEVF